MRRESAQLLISKALDLARSTGILPKAEDLTNALKTASTPADNLFASSTDMERDFLTTRNRISALNDLAEDGVKKTATAMEIAQSQLSTLEATYKATVAGFDNAEKAAKDVLDATLTKWDTLLENAKMQLEVANGTYKEILALPAALTAFVSALTGLAEQKGTTSMLAAAQASNPLVKSVNTGAYYSSFDPLRNGVESNNAWVMSTVNAMKAASRVDGSHADGLDSVPFDNYRANLHAGERVLTAKASKDADTTAEEIRHMRAEMNAALLSIAQNTSKSAKIANK